MKNLNCCHLYDDSKLPPCAIYLNNTDPIIKDGKLIYRNRNRLFLFTTIETLNQDNPPTNDAFMANIQISLCHYIIGLFLNEIMQDLSKYKKDCIIHSNPKINTFIHDTIQDPPKLNDNFRYSLTLLYTNQDAILHPFTYIKIVHPLVFVILLVLNRIDANPGLYFMNNNFVTEDTINFIFSQLHLEFPQNDLYNILKNKHDDYKK